MGLKVDRLYIEARRVLLDALQALEPLRDAFVVVGAQAIYIQTGESDFGVAPYTTDADLAVEPGRLKDEPTIGDALTSAGFRPSVDPGIWETTVTVDSRETVVPVDLLVPEGFASPGGRRGARLGPHGRTAARKVSGLEACLVDNDLLTVDSFDPEVPRSVTARVAGPTALLIAKVYKIRDRIATGKPTRIDDKDAGDAYRLMLTTKPRTFASKVVEFQDDPRVRDSVNRAMSGLTELFGRSSSPGVQMAVRSLRLGVPEERVVEVCTAFARETTEL